MTNRSELVEIAHCGGSVTLELKREPDGRISTRTVIRHARANAAAFFGLYAIPQGVAAGDMVMGGYNQPSSPPPFPGCYPVYLSSDSTGLFGRQCPSCNGYWRTDYGHKVCPYCGFLVTHNYHLLTDAQQQYVNQYCATLRGALNIGEPGEYVIDMDTVADAVGKDSPKPPFYYAEERQQNEFKCEACGDVSDVLGRYAYCSSCGTRNDLQELSATLQGIRDRINAGGQHESCAKDVVAAFDSFADANVEQLVARVPLTAERKARMTAGRFHDLQRVATDFGDVFGIHLFKRLDDAEIKFGTLMFHRRHVYEHKGGEADEKYIADSGDNVRPKQVLRESQESAHRIATIVTKLATTLHKGFHELLPPLEEPIRNFEVRKQRGYV